MLDLSRIRAITLDLDDTLWPVWPVIARAESVLQQWLQAHAPATAAACAQAGRLRALREAVHRQRPDLAHDLSALRRESIRLALVESGDDPGLADPAFEVFFAERHRVDLFDDAGPALEFRSARFPVVALSTGNADVHRAGIGRHFRVAVSARSVGVGKPDRRIFEAAADSVGVHPHEVLHVGDDPHLDGAGALAAGMQIAWINRAGHDWPGELPAPQVQAPDLGALCARLEAVSSGFSADRRS